MYTATETGPPHDAACCAQRGHLDDQEHGRAAGPKLLTMVATHLARNDNVNSALAIWFQRPQRN
jgi:hypothetical protein